MKHSLLFVLFLGVFAALAAHAQAKPNPYDALPKVPPFPLTSTDVRDGAPLAAAQMSGVFGVPGGQDLSPQLSWAGAPAGTRSFVVTVYDPDAPAPGGFWHWLVVDLPASTSSLPTGAGSADGKRLPPGAWQLANGAQRRQFLGAAPPPGTGRHRYFIVVQALDVASLGLPKDATAAVLTSRLKGHVLGRAMLVPFAERE
jgi:hypothetical protein